MSNPHEEFVEAMRTIFKHYGPLPAYLARRICIAFADAVCEAKQSSSECDQRAWKITENEPTTTSEQHKRCRAALLHEVGLEENDAKAE